MMIKRSGLFLCTMVFFVVPALGKTSHARRTKLNEKRITIQMANKPLFTVFARLTLKYDIAIGFEESALDSSHSDYFFETNVPSKELRPQFARDKEFVSEDPEVRNHLISVDFIDAPLEEVINDIVRQMQHYAWNIKDDVVNIYPIRGRDATLRKLLELRIKEFSAMEGIQVSLLPVLLWRLPEFESFIADHHLRVMRERSHALWFLTTPLSAQVKLTDLTFGDLLNAVTRIKRGGWILRYNKDYRNEEKNIIEILL